jgi:hypothetical protein
VAKKRDRVINLPAPYLRRVWLERALVKDAAAYPFFLLLPAKEFELGGRFVRRRGPVRERAGNMFRDIEQEGLACRGILPFDCMT